MSLNSWIMKKGAPGKAAKILAKMYVHSKLQEPNKPDIYHLLGILFFRWMSSPLPGNKDRLRHALPTIRASLSQGSKFGLVDLVMVVLNLEADIEGIERDVFFAVSEVLRKEGIPDRDMFGASVDPGTIEAVFSDFPTV